jgi:hypothetical protein
MTRPSVRASMPRNCSTESVSEMLPIITARMSVEARVTTANCGRAIPSPTESRIHSRR